MILQAWPQWTWQRHLFQCDMAHRNYWRPSTVLNSVKCMVLPTSLLNSEKVLRLTKAKKWLFLWTVNLLIMISEEIALRVFYAWNFFILSWEIKNKFWIKTFENLYIFGCCYGEYFLHLAILLIMCCLSIKNNVVHLFT